MREEVKAGTISRRGRWPRRARVRAQLSPVIHLYVDGAPAQLAALEELMEKLEAYKMMVMRGCPGATQATQACDVAKMHWEDVLEECRGQDERAHQAVETGLA